MDIIGACEAEGYDFVTKNDNVYVFEDEHNYVFVDTTEECVADGSRNYLSAFDFDHDFSTLAQGYVTMVYNIRDGLAPGRYTKDYHITTMFERDAYFKGIYFTLDIEVKEDGNSSFEYDTSSSLDRLKISAKAGDSVTVQLEVDRFLKEAKQDDVVICGQGQPFTRIFPAKLESERKMLKSKIDDFKQYPSYAERYFPEGAFEILTQREYNQFLRSCEQRVGTLRMIFNDAHIFVYNKESGNVSRIRLDSAVDEDSESFQLSSVFYSFTIDTLSNLDPACLNRYDTKSAQRILAHLDDLGYDINARNATGQMLDAFKAALGKEITYNDVTPGMVIAKKDMLGLNSYDIFEVTGISEQLKNRNGDDCGILVTKNSGFTISLYGDLQNYSSVEAKYNLSHNEPDEYLNNRDTYFELDKSVMGAASLLDKVTGNEHKSFSIDNDHKINRMIKAVQEEINEERGIQPMFQG